MLSDNAITKYDSLGSSIFKTFDSGPRFMVFLLAFLSITPNFIAGSEDTNNETTQISAPVEEASKMDCNYGTADFGFKPVKGEVNEPVTQVVGPNGGCLQVTLSDETMYILLIPPGSLNENTEITLTRVQASDYPDLGAAAAGGNFGVDFKPDGLKFFIPVLLKIQYTDSAMKAIAKELGISTDEAEKGLTIYTFGPDPVFGDNVYEPLRALKKDVENNIMIVEVERF